VTAVSPYRSNPLNINPLKELLEQLVDFDSVRACQHVRLFISATNVRDGRSRSSTMSAAAGLLADPTHRNSGAARSRLKSNCMARPNANSANLSTTAAMRCAAELETRHNPGLKDCAYADRWLQADAIG
jgi:hypothetical protein